MSLSLLSRSVETDVAKKLGDKTSVLGNAISVAKLFVAEGGVWKDTEIYGIVLFCKDREHGLQSIRIYEFNTLVLRFQAEIPYDPVFVEE
jgi:hypothetical protein